MLNSICLILIGVSIGIVIGGAIEEYYGSDEDDTELED